MLLYLCPLSAVCESLSVSVPFTFGLALFNRAGGQTQDVDPILG